MHFCHISQRMRHHRTNVRSCTDTHWGLCRHEMGEWDRAARCYTIAAHEWERLGCSEVVEAARGSAWACQGEPVAWRPDDGPTISLQ